MFSISTVFLLVAVAATLCNAKAVSNSNCRSDDVDFANKVANSSFVVYGKPTAKTLYNNSDTMFYGTFRVDCILKGLPIANFITILNAGRVEGRTYCQDLSVGGDHIIAFLERDTSKKNESDVFIPADFTDMTVDGNSTAELLANTCNLQKTLPIGSTATDVCPAVSTNPQCAATTPSTLSELATVGTVIITGSHLNGTEIIRSKSGTIQVDVDTNKGNSYKNVNVLLILAAVMARLY